MNRTIAFCLLVLQLALMHGGQASASTDVLANLDDRVAGHPTMTIRITPQAIEAPDRVAAGPTLVVEENMTAATGHVFVARVPDDITEAEVQAFTDAATAPLAHNPEPPAWFFRSLFVGNPDRAAPDGGQVVALVDLVPGRYLVLDPYRPPAEGARFEVEAGAVAQSVSEGEMADVVVTMYEMGFDLPAVVPAGPRLWEVVNAGVALHEIAILPVPEGATTGQVEAALMAAAHAEAEGESFDGQPAPPELGPVWADWRLQLVHGVGVMSPGRSALASFDLPSGTYAAVCFVPDPVTGTPHVMMGMSKIFTVAGDAMATPVA